ncbi:MAG: TonB-dependent siderophore receptor [Arcobacter sp.]|jgi:outer membrane receptor for ferric coprogen and ferric-rhodotorulic acid|uniref:TonB-dependent siderophore receptor n=1 Tax=Arcobacter sp. TaxID=1872629 RepID=UPI0025829DE9|nr:TonB-dependent siderophore receptor [Arcobacter sp.]MDD3009124.1 TonB-dependent siderophore receptor [Arcobacter sp.]MDX9814973.1 TonB-dependent siderophore receptor [Sulfurimonadaceae bacterium]MDY3203670.1 TonB-dependent siderophore receptor [Arcobacter sp.]
MKNIERKIIPLSLCLSLALSANAKAEEKTILEEIKVSEELGYYISEGTTEGVDSYTTKSMGTATKLEMSLRETPQSVMVFTRQKLDDQNITTYQEMLAKTPGVTLNQWDERVYPTARGFDVDYYLFDGVPTYSINDNADDPDLAIYDRVEVVKGANGLMTGAGNPALGINFIRKHATSKELTGTVDLSAGSWNNYSSTADIQTGLNEKGNIRARVVAKHQDKESYMDNYDKSTNVLYGVVDMDLTDTTFLSLGTSIEDIDRSGIRWGGMPAFYSDGTRATFDNSKTISDDWTAWNIQTTTNYVDFKQYVHNDISLNASLVHRDIKADGNLAYFGGTVDKTTGNQVVGAGDFGLYGYGFANETKENSVDLYASIPFELAKLDHEIIVGTMYTRSKKDKSTYSSNIGWTTINFNNISISEPVYTSINPLASDETTQTGTYLAGKFSLKEDLKLISGIRVSSWKYENEFGTGNRDFDNELTPYVGLVYDLDKNHSIYTSYTSIFKPQSKKDSNGSYLDPIAGNNYEVGVKGEYFDGNLNTSLSLFRIEQDGVGEDTGMVNSSLETIYEAKDGVVSKGFEVGVSGNITDKLSLDFGLANFEAKNPDGTDFNTSSSRTTANIFAKYKVNDYRFGAGLNYKSKYYTSSSYGDITQDGFITTDLMAGYKVNKNLDLQLNINNLFDEEYYSGLGVNSMVYGDPRNATLGMKYTF